MNRYDNPESHFEKRGVLTDADLYKPLFVGDARINEKTQDEILKETTSSADGEMMHTLHDTEKRHKELEYFSDDNDAGGENDI
eukprot:TRINITY_DN19830_c0_g1_i1.p1 TRINITY_DN19830_c0_g1~~TRINITY_DN19830_c0_g1_i1.p1  ORF type:complete len:83 (+),score=24.42 TRINITY_DN19830_c0_g1_i1:28-276(+)